MARAIWSGAISFGLVAIPVELYSATSDHTVHFNQFQRGTSDRIRYKRVNERTGKEVDYSDIVKGREVGDGQFVLVEPDELADIAPGRSRTIDIDAFVDLDEIDPIFYQKTYWLAPAKKEYARPYALLAKAMTESNRAGIATFVMRGKQYLTAVRARDGIMALETMYFADEIRDPAEVKETVKGAKAPHGKELKMATSLIESLSEAWKPDDYRDTYTDKVNKLIEDKAQGNEIVVEAEPPEATEVTDLMEALRRSVESTKGRTKQRKKSPDLSDLSKAELDERARDLEIKGRSKMNRAELEKAVAKAS
ncbi:Ku protein [Kibdelosporangium aridum]|uniref:Non-homologous end joining protein Ku n=1 Tax=Kibdelosporangium aridum TaxID=2030 RepID=A0A428YX47_KIBAR|nr:Ku protein [Kibdelosporangium aridum]RSM74738.1 Ku protein [Kibdelosporangium aridum]